MYLIHVSVSLDSRYVYITDILSGLIVLDISVIIPGEAMMNNR